MAQTVLDSDLQVKGTVIAQTFRYPAGSIVNADIGAGAAIAASKLQRQQAFSVELCPEGTNISAIASKLLHIFRAGGTINGIEAAITGAATGDRAATVDLQKGNAGGSFATILTAPIAINSSLAVRTPLAGAISSGSAADGDLLRLVVGVSGSTGTQPQGLLVTVTCTEDYSA